MVNVSYKSKGFYPVRRNATVTEHKGYQIDNLWVTSGPLILNNAIAKEHIYHTIEKKTTADVSAILYIRNRIQQ